MGMRMKEETGSAVAGTEGDFTIVGSHNKVELMEQCHELLRSKSAPQQSLTAASQLIGSPLIGSPFPCSPKAAALMVHADMNRFNPFRLETKGFSIKGEAGMVNPASRQIYLSFPADSTFREEDVSNYFRKQQMEIGEFSPRGAPTGMDLQQALELQNTRLMDLQLLDLKKLQHQRGFSSGSPIPSPARSPILYSRSLVLIFRATKKLYRNCSSPMPAIVVTAAEKQTTSTAGKKSVGTEESGSDKEGTDCEEVIYRQASFLINCSVEHSLPDSPFVSPAKASRDNSAFPNADIEKDGSQALELQNTRLMDLQLLDLKKLQHQRGFSSGSPIPSPARSPILYSRSLVLTHFQSNQEALQVTDSQSSIAENCSSPMPAIVVTAAEKQTTSTAGKKSVGTEESGSDKEGTDCEEVIYRQASFLINCSVEHSLPDSPFVSPAKASRDNSAFPNADIEKDGSRPDMGPSVCMPAPAAYLPRWNLASYVLCISLDVIVSKVFFGQEQALPRDHNSIFSMLELLIANQNELSTLSASSKASLPIEECRAEERNSH
ncbi:hypothetical protein F3Y22_tig00111402pilonHSYRG01239 [Hibiscus syriacus]|uniref:Uncharacterized protein n=1 Tax=Hibiscus syriacus TaxID=106335 RepID=A0A6A2YJJ3_HIBSY|nr:hypothetical protein F3Y22_tig00111402pilonHSYRG01239 [Hibiscus syriacus]